MDVLQQYKHDLLVNAGVEPLHYPCEYDNYNITHDWQKEAVEAIKTLGDKWALLTGQTGSGKNHLITALLKQKINEKKKVKIIRIKRFMDELFALDFPGKRDFLEEFENYDILVIDEIGRSTDKKFFHDTIFELLITRYNNFRQTVLISNLNTAEFLGMFDTALQRRITDGSVLIEFKGGVK